MIIFYLLIKNISTTTQFQSKIYQKWTILIKKLSKIVRFQHHHLNQISTPDFEIRHILKFENVKSNDTI